LERSRRFPAICYQLLTLLDLPESDPEPLSPFADWTSTLRVTSTLYSTSALRVSVGTSMTDRCPEREQHLSSISNLTASREKSMWISGCTYRSSFNCDSSLENASVSSSRETLGWFYLRMFIVPFGFALIRMRYGQNR
jgi:hypothetical protein